MIETIGKFRVLVLGVLIIVNALAALAYYMYLEPENKKISSQLSTAKNNVTTTTNDLAAIRADFDDLESKQEEFQGLRDTGFFGDQSRRVAEEAFEEIRVKSGVINAIVTLSPARQAANEIAKKAEHAVLESPMTIKIEALDDADVYRYIYLVQEYFPGQNFSYQHRLL